MSLDEFNYFIRITVRFADADMMGHVNNAKYVTYLEEARIQYARDVLGWQKTPRELGMILARTEIDYLRPLMFGDTVRVYVRCSKIGRKSFALRYVLVDDASQEIVSNAMTAMVAFDYTQGVSVPVEQVWKDRILAYETTPPEMG